MAKSQKAMSQKQGTGVLAYFWNYEFKVSFIAFSCIMTSKLPKGFAQDGMFMFTFIIVFASFEIIFWLFLLCSFGTASSRLLSSISCLFSLVLVISFSLSFSFLLSSSSFSYVFISVLSHYYSHFCLSLIFTFLIICNVIYIFIISLSHLLLCLLLCLFFGSMHCI